MAVPRASARWTSRYFNQSARTARNTTRTRSWRQTQRRGYASEGGKHDSQQSGLFAGDLPWAIGATVFTVPSVWYLLQPQIERWNRPKGDGHGHGHDGEGEGEGHDEHSKESEASDETEGQKSSENNQDESSEAGDEGDNSDSSNSESGDQDTPETSEDEGSEKEVKEIDSGKSVPGVQFKGATSGDSNDTNEQTDTRKLIPDAKGGTKKRIESDYAKVQGQADSPEQDSAGKDMAAPSKPVDDKKMLSQSGKQEGISNTDTKHSTDIGNDPTKSKKGEGVPETAKSKGTVDPYRPQV